jgi:hypothetical protein
MEDKQIVDLYWQRDERAIAETAASYSAEDYFRYSGTGDGPTEAKSIADSALEYAESRFYSDDRSIQAEGVFGIITWDRSYKRLFRRGAKAVNLELTLISCGFNIYKYHNKKQKNEETA